MGNFDPNKLSFVDCEAVKFDFETHPMLRDHAAAVHSNWDVSQNLWPNPESNSLFVFLKFEASVSDKAGRTIAKVKACFRCLYVIDNIQALITINPEGGGTLDHDAIIATLSIGLSTSRGQLQFLLAKTPFKELPLPVLTIDQLFAIPAFDIREFFPDWYENEVVKATKEDGV